MGGKPPAPPDPAKTAAAQGAWDMTTSQTNAITNNANVVNPYGTTSYAIAGYEDVTTPEGKTIKVPRYTQTQTLSEVGQGQFDNRNAVIDQLFGRVQNGGGSYGVAQLDDNFLKPQEATMATDRSRVEQSLMERANPLLKQGRDAEVARLAAMGLAPGSEKYGRVADQFERSSNDLALAAVAAGGQEQSRLLDLFNRGTSASNDAKPTQTNLNMNQRQALINELLSMFTGQQPGGQAQTQYQGFASQSPDYTGLVNNQYQQQVSAYNNKQAGIGNIFSTVLGLF